MPWKNGGGWTTEIVVSPPGASLEEFDWRISMACVSTNGPFSLFPGIDRTLVVLEGIGMRLAVEGLAPVELTPDSFPLSFSGDVNTDATLLGGEITDLNVMTRRGRFVHRVSRQDIVAAVGLTLMADVTVILSRSARLSVMQNQMTEALGPDDAALLARTEGTTVRLRSDLPGDVFVIEIDSSR